MGSNLSIPPSATHIRFSSGFCKKLKPSDLPQSLVSLTLSYYTGPLPLLPPNVKNLTVLDAFNKQLSVSLPPLTHLTLGDSFNQPLDWLPASLTHLVIGHDFDCMLDHLPSSLTHLTLGNCFNKPLDHLPGSLAQLSIGNLSKVYECKFNFNYPLDYLPSSLVNITLILKEQYGFLLHNLPSSVVNMKSNRALGHLPASIIFLDFIKTYSNPENQAAIDNLPPSLTHFRYHGDYFFSSFPILCIDHLPSFLTHLYITCTSYAGCLDNLPPTLILLSLCGYTAALDHLPSSLKKLECNPQNQYLDNSALFMDHLPASLTHLTIMLDRNVDYLPSSLTHLGVNSSYNVDYLPSSITHLFFGVLVTQPLDNLPISVTYLYISSISLLAHPSLPSPPSSLLPLLISFAPTHPLLIFFT